MMPARALRPVMVLAIAAIVGGVLVRTHLDRTSIAQATSEPLSWPPPADTPMGLDHRLLDPTITVPKDQ